MKQAIYYFEIGENIQKMDCIKRQKCKKDTKNGLRYEGNRVSIFIENREMFLKQ